MRVPSRVAALALVATALATTAHADGRQAGSALVFTVHRSGPEFYTIVSVTNTSPRPGRR